MFMSAENRAAVDMPRPLHCSDVARMVNRYKHLAGKVLLAPFVGSCLGSLRNMKFCFIVTEKLRTLMWIPTLITVT